eukprot:TRINITY_DN111888_c0_g1_i1.p1 TRINITY_DN111888_c0_g1~~TRINITY_DN111888_c0_g1_i1.p1  ORF type:complete len:1062 (-),score=339.81 TRINITY_DN111888_c0_g1_i1:187-3372(-)
MADAGGFPTSGVFPNGPPPWMANAVYGGPPRMIDVVLGLRKNAAQGPGLPSASAAGGGLGSSGVPEGEAPPAQQSFAAGDGSVDYYKTLEVEPSADEAAVKKSYRKLVLKWHPDKHPENREDADDMIRRVNTAYETLGNKMKREAYDQMREALERKKRGVKLCTNCIQPRMSIPKEFMLNPLGHPDKFVRVVGTTLKVQSRDEVLGLGFKEFFKATKFSLWWLPEVNNMCRLRTLDSAGIGIDGGLNMNFLLDTKKVGVPDADVVLSMSTDPRYANLIAVASPFSQGAFRFEGAFWPQHYLSFKKATSTLRMTAQLDEGAGDTQDFVLVDGSTIYKYMTMPEVLAGPIQTQGEGEYVKLTELRADMSVRTYFQNTMGIPVWNNKEFEVFFEAHYDQFDFDFKRARVRMRSKEQQFAQRLEKAQQRQGELVQALLSAGDEDEAAAKAIYELPGERLRTVLEKVVQDAPKDATPAALADLQVCRRRVFTAVGWFCSGPGATSSPLTMLLAMRSLLAAEQADSSNVKTQEARKEASTQLSSVVVERLKWAPTEVEGEAMLLDILALPVSLQPAADAMQSALNALMTDSAKPAGHFLKVFRAAAARDDVQGLVQACAAREMKSLQQAQGAKAADVLLALLEGPATYRSEVIAKLQNLPLLQRLPLPELIDLVSAIVERCIDTGGDKRSEATVGEALKLALQTRILVAGPMLADVSPQRLLRLAKAATKSAVIAEVGLGPVAGAAAAKLKDEWSLDDIATLLLAVSHSQASVDSPGAHKLYAKATEVFTPRLGELQKQQLLKTVLAISSISQCKSLLEAFAKEAASRLSDFLPAQLVLLTQGLSSLGAENDGVKKVLAFWADFFAGKEDSDSKKGTLSVDHTVKLLNAVAPISEKQEPLLKAMGETLVASFDSLSGASTAVLQELLEQDTVPAFASKDKLLQLLKEKQAQAREKKTKSSDLAKRSRSRDNASARDKPQDRQEDGGKKTKQDKGASPVRSKRGSEAEKRKSRSRSRRQASRRSPSRYKARSRSRRRRSPSQQRGRRQDRSRRERSDSSARGDRGRRR